MTTVRPEPPADRGASALSTRRARLSALLGERRGLGPGARRDLDPLGSHRSRHAGGGRAGRGRARQRDQAACTCTSARCTSWRGWAPSSPSRSPSRCCAWRCSSRSRSCPRRIAADVQSQLRQQPVSRFHARLLGGAVARPRGTAAGDDDKSGDAGDLGRAAGDVADHLAVHLPGADRHRAGAQRRGRRPRARRVAAADRGAAPAALDRSPARPRALAGAGAVRGRHQRGHPAGRGDAGVRRGGRAARARRRLRRDTRDGCS